MPTIVPIKYYYRNFLPSNILVPVGDFLDKFGLELEAANVTWDSAGLVVQHRIHMLDSAKFDFPIIPGSAIEFEPKDSNPGVGLNIFISDRAYIELEDVTFRLAFSGDHLPAYTRNREGIYEPIENIEEEDEVVDLESTDKINTLGLAIDINMPLARVSLSGMALS